MKRLLFFLMMLYALPGLAQLNESFADGNFTTAPEWKGDVTAFIVNTSKQLQTTQNASAQTFSLATPNTLAINARWEFYIQLNFDPSANNQVRIYLTSDNENLKGALNGYFVQVGETGSTDSYDFYRQSGTSVTKIIDGPAKTRTNTNQLIARIQVTRTSASLWDLKTDITGGTNFTSEGTVTDNTITSSSWFGVYCKYTTTNSDKFFFDDLKAEILVSDTQPPKLISATAIDSLTVEAVFDEALDSLSAKEKRNYSLSRGYGNPISVKTTFSPLKYHLTFAKSFLTDNYTLSVTGVKDLNNNLIAGNNTAVSSYIKPYYAQKNDLVINEIFADSSPQIDLPSVEFVEFLNTTNHTISLQNWNYSDATTSVNLPADSIKSGQYLILSAKSDTAEFKKFGRVLGISPWPSLNNSGDALKITNPEGKVIDSVSYSDTWHRVTAKKAGGWSLERIDPKCNCTGLSNWNSSVDSTGGTPGRQNSIYKTSYVPLAFKADSLKQLSDTTLKIFFNKPIDKAGISSAKFVLEPAVKGNSSLLVNDAGTQITIKYSYKFSYSTLYKLSVSGLLDSEYNLIENSNQPFSFTAPPDPAPVITNPVKPDTAKVFITNVNIY